MKPPRRAFAGELKQTLRYGENSHQQAAFYTDGTNRPGVATAVQHQGKELSYNNINDTDAAFELVAEFDPAQSAACAIIKHANPCGVATGATLLDAYKAAFDCDRTSAFGGIVALNQPLDAETAQEITGIFTEVVIAPGASDEAKAIFAAKKNLRLLTTEGLPDVTAGGKDRASGGRWLLVQDKDNGFVGMDDLKVVTKKAPTEEQMRDLLFAWKVAKHVKSNAIVYVKDGATVGRGRGPDEPSGFGHDRREESRTYGRRAGPAATADHRLGRGLGCVLPLPRRADGGRRGRCDLRDPARRLDAR